MTIPLAPYPVRVQTYKYPDGVGEAKKIWEYLKILQGSLQQDAALRITDYKLLAAIADTNNSGNIPKIPNDDTKFLSGKLTWLAAGGGSGESMIKAVAQAAHGFSAGDVVKCTGTNTYAKAMADSAADAEVAGIVSSVTDGGNFNLLMGGYWASASVPAVAAGTVMFLSPTVAGGMTSTEPTAASQVSKPLGIVVENAAKMLVFNMRGEVVGSALPGAWTSFSPSITNLTVGAGGTLTGYYMQIGKLVYFRVYFKYGAGSSVSGGMVLTLPVTAATYGEKTPIGNARFFDNSTADIFWGHIGNTGALYVDNAAGTYLTYAALSSTVPMTWATDDYFTIQGSYEAA